MPKPWNAGRLFPDGLATEPRKVEPLPERVVVGHSTGAHGLERRWYVHVHECGGVWHMVSGGPVDRDAADKLAGELRATGKRVDVTSDWERRGL